MVKIGKEEYWTISEYAEKYGVTIQTVYNWYNSGKLKHKKIMGKLVVRSD